MAHESVDRLAATERVFETLGVPGEPLTTREVAEALELTRRSAYERLSALADRDAIETKKVGARGRIWWRPEAVDREEAAFTEAVLDMQPDMVYAYDVNGRLKRWNERFVEVTGSDPGTLDGKPVGEFLPPEQRERLAAVSDDLIQERRTRTIKSPLLTTEGERIPYEFTSAPITNGDGEVIGVAGIGRDVSQRVASKRQLRRERDFGDRLVEASPASILVFSRDGTVVRANDHATERLDISAVGETSFHPADLDIYDDDGDPISLCDRPTRLAFETGEAITDFHCQIELPDGGMQWLSIDAFPLGSDDPVERVLVSARDITELKHHTEQLERERASLETELEDVFARVDDAFVAMDHELRYTFVNARAEEILGQSTADLLGRRAPDVFPELRDSQFFEDCERAMETQSPISREAHYDAIDSWLEATVYPSESGVSIYFRDVTERKERERALAEQRERLAALHNLNEVVRDINEAVLQQSTREDIERLVCARIAATDSYEFAWIGEGDAATRTIEPLVEAGVEGYVDEIPLSTDAGDPTGRGLPGRALRTGQTQVSTNARTDPRFAPWREYAREYGFSAAAAIPIVHEDSTYGVLCVYADRAGAFTDEERAVVSHLGEVVGHAIAAVERKRALMSDEVVEIELYAPHALEAVDADVDTDVRISFDQTVPVGDGSYVVYGSTSSDGLATMQTIATHLDHWESVTELFAGEDGVRYELRLSEPPVISAIASNGGSIASAAIDDGEYHVVVHLPTDVDVRGFVDVVSEAAPEITLVARRQITQDRSPEAVAADLAATLTERQRATLEASYYAGYFDWPRERDGNDVAATLDITPPTFHQHLRSAQRKLLEALLD